MTQAVDLLQQNNAMRAALLATAPRMRKKLGVFGPFQIGESMRQKLFNVGIGTSLDIMVTASVDQSAALTASPRAPFNLLDKIRVTDYDGTDRINCSGYQLFLNRTVRQNANELNGYHNTPAKSATYALPSVPTNADGTLRFCLNVPFAYDPESDLRGAMLMQTAVGEAFLNIDFNAQAFSAGNDDAVYTAGTLVGLTDIYVTVYQNYLNPLQIGNQVPLPMLDLQTVYELNGSLKSSDSIAVGTEKLLNYPNVRTVLGTYLEYVNGGVMQAGSTDVTAVNLIANGNTKIQEWGPFDLAHKIREQIGCDLPVGSYYISSRARPIETQLYGNVQLGITPAAVSAGKTYMGVMFEAFYSKGVSLPGLTQG
jgi:hypothetical protein